MGIAQSYEQHIDPGLAFGEEEIKAFDPKGWAALRVEELSRRLATVQKLLTMADVPKHAWWKDVAKRLEAIIGWYCIVATVETPLPLALPQPKSKGGKDLATKALNLQPDTWIDAFHTDALVQLQHVASLGQACLQARELTGWKKAEGKLVNRLLNCLTNEERSAVKFQEELTARKEEVDKS